MSTIVPTNARERVSAAAAQLQEQARAIRTAASPELPKRVYHYTSAPGLLGILDSRKLWASHFHHMNDSEELALGQKVGLELVREHFWEWPDERIRSAVLLAEAVADHREEASVFLVSFSSEPDSLPQWRTYGAEGTGFALGFTLRHGWSFGDDADFAVVQCVCA